MGADDAYKILSCEKAPNWPLAGGYPRRSLFPPLLTWKELKHVDAWGRERDEKDKYHMALPICEI